MKTPLAGASGATGTRQLVAAGHEGWVPDVPDYRAGLRRIAAVTT